MSGSFISSIKEGDLKEGSMKRVHIRGRELLLVRKAGAVYGIDNRCPHMGCSLEKGILRDYMVMCPCHGWKFDIRTGQYQDNDAITLESYICEEKGGKILVQIP